MNATTYRDRLNVDDLANDFEVHSTRILSRHSDIWTST